MSNKDRLHLFVPMSGLSDDPNKCKICGHGMGATIHCAVESIVDQLSPISESQVEVLRAITDLEKRHGIVLEKVERKTERTYKDSIWTDTFKHEFSYKTATKVQKVE